MKPFDDYPNQGRKQLGPTSGFACRTEYGLKFQKITGQTHCAYCGISLVDDYHHWLLLCLDHVIPVNQAEKLGIQVELYDDCINKVLCFSGCNGFHNRWRIPDDWQIERKERVVRTGSLRVT